MTKHQNRSHQSEAPSQPVSQAPTYQQPNPNFLQPEENFSGSQTAFLQPAAHNFYTPHTQASEHSVPVTASTLPLTHEVHYPTSNAIYQPHSDRYEVGNALDSIPRFPLAVPKVVPLFESRTPMIYHGEMGIDKPITSRIFNPPQDRISWDFLGLEN